MRPLPVFNITPLETLRHFGAAKALAKVVMRILRVRPVVIMALDLTAQAPQASSDGDIRAASPDDVALLDGAGFPGFIEKKLPYGPIWLSLGNEGLRAWYALARCDCEIADWLYIRSTSPTTIWVSGIWVHRTSRGHDMANRIQSPALHWSKQQGYEELAAWVDRTNHSSLRAAHKSGYQVIGSVIAFRRFGVAVVRHGRRWSLGRWNADRPLVISLEELRQDFRPATPIHRPAA